MCGIVGVADFRGGAGPDPGLLATMTDTLAHRGPDGRMVLRLDDGGSPRLTFGFRRLSIIDLGAGARAYSDESGNIRAICNGEIYNWPELERDLKERGHRFETRCDTEVLPHLYEEHGLDFVTRLNGMFAFAIFDARAERLVLGRDRVGEKPLYYVDRPGELLFGSEIKALLAHPDVSRARDLEGLTRYLLYGYFPAPWTPFRDIRKLPAGHLLIAERGRVRIEPYWSAQRFVPVAGSGAAGEPSEREAAAEVRRLLREGVALRLRADVPVGVFFSGGIDSSAIAALAVEVQGKPVPTFSLGFEDQDFDESGYARRAAERLGTEHHEIIVGEKDLVGALFSVARILDEPLADASVLPTWLLSRFARRHVKVTLGGEGGDELFAGYPTYIGDRLARHYNRLPRAARAIFRRAVEAMPPGFSNVGPEFLLKKFVASADRPDDERHPIWFGAFPPERQRELLSDGTLQALEGLPGGHDPLREARAIRRRAGFRHPLDALLLTDFLLYLQDDLLTKIDRASMAASLEVRAPFLHHPLFEYVSGLPARYKLHGHDTKWILKRAMGDSLSAEITGRRKRGFNIPLARLLLGPLTPLLQRAFDPERLRREGLLRPEAVGALWEAHRTRRRDHGRLLWNLLMLQLWLSRTESGGDLLDGPGGAC
ncbi:MAG TPA: asparagine synthase (glutamine-hydrolyzing) [Verrucomicrobiae bacterium]|nr:asparagine synthase (glutamine-hydrolyzing) [Verrucomicrobiae bacterium]